MQRQTLAAYFLSCLFFEAPSSLADSTCDQVTKRPVEENLDISVIDGVTSDDHSVLVLGDPNIQLGGSPIYFTEDGGKRWSELHLIHLRDLFPRGVAVYPDKWVANFGKLLICTSVNSGSSWREANASERAMLSALRSEGETSGEIKQRYLSISQIKRIRREVMKSNGTKATILFGTKA